MDRKIEKKRFTPKKIATVAIPTAFVFIVLYALIFGDRSSKLNVEVERITISEVKRGEFQEYIPVTGAVIPIDTYYLSASDGGMVEDRIVEAGTFVEKGDPIVRLSNTDLLMTILNNEANVNRASNDMRIARLQMEQNRLSLRSQMANLNYDLLLQKRSYDRSKELYEKNLVSKEEFELARDEYQFSLQIKELTLESMRQDSLFRMNQIQQLELSLEQMRSNLEIVRRKLQNLTIRAPIKGQLTSLDAEIGDTKSRGERIGQIDVLDSFRVRAGIDEHYLARIETGRHGAFDFAGNSHRLIVTTIYPEVTDGRFEVDLEFVDKLPEGIRRGQTTHIRLELGDLSEELLLARGGWYQRTGGQWVYVVDKSGGFATKRRIRVGMYNPQYFTILEGLEPGERVITSSYDSFGDIDKLILKE
jgi:HlyD family secretion protein